MAQTPAAVNEFLGKVQAAVDEVEARELADCALTSEVTGPTAAPMLFAGTWRFIRSATEERFKIDQKRCALTFRPPRACFTR